MKALHFVTSVIAATSIVATAEERTHTEEEMRQLAESGELQEQAPTRPAKLPDLTKGDQLPPSKDRPQVWTLGPSGVAAIMVGGFSGDQLLVKGALKGSPAEGKVLEGDVITGINGRKFNTGEHLGITIGNAIIESEKEENGGSLKLSIWRDLNYVARNGKKDMAAVDVDALFEQARDDNSLYDWKPEEAREQEVRQAGFDEFPLKPTTMEVELTLRTLPAYSDSAPYDCPKTRQILEEAWQVLARKFVPDPNVKRSGRGGIIEAIALIASGKPEYRKLVHDWVRSEHSPWRPPTEPIGAMFEPGYKGSKGYQSWHKGFAGLYCAIYYDATGDDYVLPALRKYAIETAMGQSASGSWGHTFAYPSFNGGELHKMNPGYGALNAAGNRCFFLVCLAQKLGIQHPEIDAAVERGRKFFGSYIDQGCIPYGDHPAANSDDSNGKNTGIAFGLKLLGDDYGSRYFALMSAHCAFTRRGGHAHDYHGNWSSWAATLLGPEIRTLNERNLRWRRTLCRMYDGSFVYHSPTGKYSTLRDPTATEVLHQASIFKQTLITGKDVDPSQYMTDREKNHMLASAASMFNDPLLKQMAGKPWRERTTDEVFDLLDTFYPKARGEHAKELANRFKAGETAIAGRLLGLLGSDNPRLREAGVRGLQACGDDIVLANLSKIIPLLDDPKEFVRITAAKAVALAGDQPATQLAMLDAVVAPPRAAAPNSVRNFLNAALFANQSPLATRPFKAGADPEKVAKALEELILLDPSRSFLESRAGVWDKETVVRIAGPLTYAAEEEQVADQMFANRSAPAREVLDSHGYVEGPLSTAHRLRKKAAIPRHIRPYVGYKDPLIDPAAVMKSPELFSELLDEITTVVTDNPNEKVTIKDKSTNWQPVSTPLLTLHATIAKAGNQRSQAPSIANDVAAAFDAELAAIDGTGAKIKHCSNELKEPARRNIFRKLAAMDRLAEWLGPEAAEFLVPYLNHDYWRLREHSRALAAEAVRSGGPEVLTSHFDPADAHTAAGILATIAQCGNAAGIPLATTALASESPDLRGQALLTLATLQGTKALPTVIERLKTIETAAERSAAEEALLALAATSATSVRDALLPTLPALSLDNRASAWFVLAKLGDDPSLDALEKAATTKSKTEFNKLVEALSYSPSRRADKMLLDFAATGEESARIVGSHAVRRLVLGPKGFGDITDAQRMDFAEPMIKMAMDKQLVEFLAGIHHARALRSLLFCLQNGVGPAAEALITNAETSPGYSEQDAKIAAETLRNVIEYIEVTQLRGGANGKDFRDYPKWKTLQARAGKALLKVHKPEAAPIPTFDNLEFE